MRSKKLKWGNYRLFFRIMGSVFPVLILGWILANKNGERQTLSPVESLNELKEKKPCIAIVIDDFGYRNDHVIDGFLTLNIQISYAVIPGHNYSSQFAREAHSKGFEVLVHMPMESHEQMEGKEFYMIHSSMTPFEIKNEILTVFNEIPEAIGMNNHQGSKITEMEWVMESIGQTLKTKDKYFLDSRTSPDTKAEESMQKLQVRTGHRNIFLDNELEEMYVTEQLEELGLIAESEGFAIGIGHARELTLSVLEKYIPEMIQKGFQFCFVSDVLK